MLRVAGTNEWQTKLSVETNGRVVLWNTLHILYLYLHYQLDSTLTSRSTASTPNGVHFSIFPKGLRCQLRCSMKVLLLMSKHCNTYISLFVSIKCWICTKDLTKWGTSSIMTYEDIGSFCINLVWGSDVFCKRKDFNRTKKERKWHHMNHRKMTHCFFAKPLLQTAGSNEKRTEAQDGSVQLDSKLFSSYSDASVCRWDENMSVMWWTGINSRIPRELWSEFLDKKRVILLLYLTVSLIFLHCSS